MMTYFFPKLSIYCNVIYFRKIKSDSGSIFVFLGSSSHKTFYVNVLIEY